MSTARTSTSRNTDRHPAQWLALVVGAAYLLVGLAGFLVTGFDNWVQPDGGLLLGFEVNGLHNVVHIAIGLLGLAMWRSLSGTRGYGWLLFAVYGVTFLYGLAVAGQDTQANFLALNQADNWLHGASALAGLAMALWPARDKDRTIDVTDRHGASQPRTTDSMSGSGRR